MILPGLGDHGQQFHLRQGEGGGLRRCQGLGLREQALGQHRLQVWCLRAQVCPEVEHLVLTDHRAVSGLALVDEADEFHKNE
jgi:hypothetical protein